ncbi:hypothetical protein F66182_2731 [Fusarium sp. NRRL 66182]|nr:hypothetical protein F66182_2731 [Fusarium sp. NRRL 66182]
MSSSSTISTKVSTDPGSKYLGQQEDAVIPSKSQIYQTFARSKQAWQVCYSANISANLGQELTVDIGHASEDEFRWWTSLLSPGQGWRPATGEQPVWAIAYTGNIKMDGNGKPDSSSGACQGFSDLGGERVKDWIIKTDDEARIKKDLIEQTDK